MATASKIYPVVQGVRVDVEALRSLAHGCDPMICRHTKCCCKSYEIPLDRSEERRVVGMMREAERYMALRDEDGDLFDPVEDMFGDSCLATHENGTCVFAFSTDEGAVRCSLHAAALDLGLPPAEVKPMACTLWPLYLVESPPPLLTVQDDALSFPCNSIRVEPRGAGTAPDGARPILHVGVREIIEAIFGAPFLLELEETLRT